LWDNNLFQNQVDKKSGQLYFSSWVKLSFDAPDKFLECKAKALPGLCRNPTFCHSEGAKRPKNLKIVQGWNDKNREGKK
jgi:hypothetical protein